MPPRFPHFVVALFLTLQASCVRGLTVFDLVIEPDVPADQQEAVINAADQWQAAVPVTFRPRVEHCDGIYPGRICVHAATADQIRATGICTDQEVIGCTNWFRGVGAEVWLTYNPPLLLATAVHELGHAQALQHSTTVPQYYGPTDADQRRSVMYPTAQGPDYVVPFPGDISQWHARN